MIKLAVKAVSVNPVEVKVRRANNGIQPVPRILGWDATGEVVVDRGVLETTTNQVLRPINPENLHKAHAGIGQGYSIGKKVLAGWE